MDGMIDTIARQTKIAEAALRMGLGVRPSNNHIRMGACAYTTVYVYLPPNLKRFCSVDIGDETSDNRLGAEISVWLDSAVIALTPPN